MVVSSFCARAVPDEEFSCTRLLLVALASARDCRTRTSLCYPVFLILFVLLSVCLCPFICARILCSIIMDLFFGWTATALTAYLAGCDVFGNNTPTSNVTDVSSQGGSVSSLVSLDH